jgi:hydroxyacylglutathione hydrolase
MRIERIVVGELATNCYLFVSGQELAIIDPGDEADKILAEVQKTKAKVKYIIHTHSHFDHVLAGDELREKTGAEILIHEKEKEFVDFKVDRFLKEKDRIKVGKDVLDIVHTPGHSPGGICLLGKGVIFTGDTIFKDGYGRTDLSGGSLEKLKNSLKKLEGLLKPGMKIYPGHGEPFTR